MNVEELTPVERRDDYWFKRDDENFCYVGAWEYKGDGVAPELSKEPLTFDNVHLATRSYK